jgi:GT2 family glycosyltransferase
VNQLVAGQHIMVGPALLDRSGTARRCKRRPSVFLDVCGLLPAAGRWAPVGWDGKLDRADRVHLVGGSVPAIEGACFVMRRADLEAIGGFDEDFFLYYEEDSLALRLARLGGGAVYEPRAIAEHPGGASTATVSALAIRQFHRSRVIFYRKRDGELRGVLTGLALVVAVLVSMPGALLNTMLARKRRTTFGDLWHALVGLVAGLTARLGSGVCY